MTSNLTRKRLQNLYHHIMNSSDACAAVLASEQTDTHQANSEVSEAMTSILTKLDEMMTQLDELLLSNFDEI